MFISFICAHNANQSLVIVLGFAAAPQMNVTKMYLVYLSHANPSIALRHGPDTVAIVNYVGQSKIASFVAVSSGECCVRTPIERTYSDSAQQS